MSDPTGRVEFELEAESPKDEPKHVDYAALKLEGDAVPEEFRGKTVTEITQMLSGTRDALRTSEQARQQAENIAKLAAAQAGAGQPAQPKPVEEPELTDEQLAELHQNDPLAAIRYMTDRATRVATRNVESRMGSLYQSAAAQMESQMRAKYPDEFELFGEEIVGFAGKLPNKEQVLGNPAAWDDLISMIRGRPGNLDRFIAKKSGNPTPEQRRESARGGQADAVGFQTTSQGTPASRVGRLERTEQMDDTMREIADKLGMSHAEYVKWFNAGARI